MTTGSSITAHDVVTTAGVWCRMLNASNWPEVTDLLASDFTCRQADGELLSKASWIAAMRQTRRSIQMADPSVRVFGKVAVLLCRHRVVITQQGPQPLVADLEVLQIWQRNNQAIELSAHEDWFGWPAHVALPR